MSRLQRIDKLMNDPENQIYDDENEPTRMRHCPHQAELMGSKTNRCIMLDMSDIPCTGCPVDETHVFNTLMEKIFNE